MSQYLYPLNVWHMRFDAHYLTPKFPGHIVQFLGTAIHKHLISYDQGLQKGQLWSKFLVKGPMNEHSDGSLATRLQCKSASTPAKLANGY